jgi:chlorobactene glucosyltransferase
MYLAIFYLIFLGLRLFILGINFNWQPYLKKAAYSGSKTISILIPARNEALNLPPLLGKLLAQTYRPLEILVYDDDSADGTWEVLEAFASISQVIKPIKGKTLPNGWLGKNHACHRLSQEAHGDYFLFLDADVQPEPWLLEKAIAYAEANKLTLLSIFPSQQMNTLGEKLVVPLMQNTLVSLLALPLVKHSNKPSLAAANGQFMFFERKAYQKLNPHAWVKNHPVEDIRIIRLFKKFHYPVATLLGNKSISCRMYSSYKQALQGFSKNYLSFFGNSKIVLILYLLLTTFGWTVIFGLPNVWSFVLLPALFVLNLLQVIISGRALYHIILAPLQQINAWILAIKAIQSSRKKMVLWKTRMIKL